MQETSRYAVGIDIGSTTVRCVVGHIDGATGTPTIVGVGKAPSTGMRKGSIAHLNGPAQAIDDALGEAERMSGYQVGAASMSINGAHIVSTKADGMIAVGAMDHEITDADLHRIEEVATMGKVPANREILEVVAHNYRLDGQDNIKDPLGMTGTRLEINASIVSALAPHVANIQKVAEMVKVEPRGIIPSVLAASRAVVTEQQMENGVAVIDFGGSTTSIAIFEEGDLQFTSVIPVGGVAITNDLAIGLKTDPEIAEKVKVSHALATVRAEAKDATVTVNKENYSFSSVDIDEIVEARLDEIFDAINKELGKAGRAGKLPSGAVLVGGSSKIVGLADYAKQKLGLAVKIGKASGFGGVADGVDEPQFAAAVGLMLLDVKGHHSLQGGASKAGAVAKDAAKNAKGMFSKFIDKFKA